MNSTSNTCTCGHCGTSACTCGRKRRCRNRIAVGAAIVILVGALVAHASYMVQAAGHTWTGQISASDCLLSHTPGMTAHDCTQLCVDQGAKYVLVSGGAVYTFANQSDPRLVEHAGDTVTVTGDLERDVLTAASIEAVNAPLKGTR